MNRLYSAFRVMAVSQILLGLPVHSHAQLPKTWQWVNQLGSDSWDISAGVVCDSKSNLYVAGSFFDTLNCSSKKIKSSGRQDLFIAIFNENGASEELIAAGGRGNDIATCLCVTPDDKLVIGGVLSDTATFDKIKVPGVSKQLFIAGMDNRRNFIWVSTISVESDASLYMIDADNQGNIFVSGDFTGTLEAGNQKVNSKGKRDVFLARFNRTGTLEKLYSFGSEEDDFPGSIFADVLGNVFLAGVFGKSLESGDVKFITGPAGTKTNVFIAKFDMDFNARWVNVLHGDDYAQIASLKKDKYGNFYAAGSFSSKLYVADTILVSNGYTDGFILKYNSEGKQKWGRGFGSRYYDYATGVNIDNLGAAFICGSLGDTLAIDSIKVEPPSSGNSALMMQFSPSGKAKWADCISGTGRIFSDGAALDKRGNLYFAGSFRNKLEKEIYTLTSSGDQDLYLAKYFNCPVAKAEIYGQRSFCPGTGTELSVNRVFANIIWNDTIFDRYSVMANVPGQYWVSMLDKKGCLLTDTVLITQNELPVFSLGNDTSMLLTDSLSLKAPAVFHHLPMAGLLIRSSTWPNLLTETGIANIGSL